MGFEKELGVSLGNVGELFANKAEAYARRRTGLDDSQNEHQILAAEYHSQSAIEAALFLRKQIEDLSTVRSMLIESHDASVDIIGSEPEKWKPQSRETADHSLPYITAVALIDGENYR
jgi:2-methylcitrate dehydratase PrpD